MSFVSIILAIVILGILIIIHEFGHYLLARKNGITVTEFAIGFGPKIVGHKMKNGTEFAWRAIPFGGSCRMLGMFEDEEEGTDNESSYDSKSVWARISVTLAGPFFNFLLAFVLAVIVIGTVGYDPAVVTYVQEGSPIEEAGISVGDTIKSYNGSAITFGKEIYLQNYVNPITSDSKAIDITYIHEGEEHTVSVTPRRYDYYAIGLSYYVDGGPARVAESDEGQPCYEAGIREDDIIKSVNGTEISEGEDLENYFNEHEITEEPLEIEFIRHESVYSTTVYPVAASAYKLGFSYNTANVKASVWETIKYSFAEIGYEIKSVFMSLGVLFSSRGSLDMLSGPVGIVEVIGETYDYSVSSGFLYTLMNMLSIMLMLSANLGIVNLFPIPGLDGGRFILLLVEAVTRKPVPKKFEGVVTLIGAGLLFILMMVVLVNDITKFF